MTGLQPWDGARALSVETVSTQWFPQAEQIWHICEDVDAKDVMHYLSKGDAPNMNWKNSILPGKQSVFQPGQQGPTKTKMGIRIILLL